MFYSCRPLSLTTEEFGRQWGQSSHDVRTKVKNVAKNLNSLMDRLSSNLPFYIVEVKGRYYEPKLYNIV